MLSDKEHKRWLAYFAPLIKSEAADASTSAVCRAASFSRPTALSA
jgi:hypothetical protein